MKKCKLNITLSLAVFMATAFLATQAFAFTYTVRSGFDTLGAGSIATGVDYYTNDILGAINPTNLSTPAAPTAEEMRWVTGLNPQSSLSITHSDGTTFSPATQQAAPLDAWVNLSTLAHDNVIIPTAFSWSGQDITTKIRIFDGATELVNDDGITTLDFLETPNEFPCTGLNPEGSICDDEYTFSLSSLAPIFFTALNGDLMRADFRIGLLVNATQVGPTVYTAEGVVSQLPTEMRLTVVPEPGTITLLGLGLMGLVAAGYRRGKKED